MRCLCEAVVQHIKLKSEGNTIQASLLVKFLHQQSAVLMSKEKQPKQATESTDLGLLCGDNQTRRFQAAAASLAQMYTHARQQSNSVEVGARRAVQDLLRALSAYDGQMLEKTTLLDFLQRYFEQQQQQMPPRTDGEHSASVFHNSFANSTVKESSVTRKRSHDVAVVLDPAFEQAFKRQRQPPPTPPRSKSIHRMVE